MKRLIAVALALSACVVAVLAFGGLATGSSKSGDNKAKQAAEGKLKAAKLTVTSNGKTTTRTLPFLSGGAVVAAQNTLGIPNGDERAEAADLSGAGGDIALDGSNGGGGSATGSGPSKSLGCGGRTSNGNKRVNQDCTYRRQAETEIAYNPADPNNLVAGQNDSRVGFNQCGIDYSTNNGTNWGDLLPPFRQKVNNPAGQEPTPADPNRHTIQGGDGTFHTYDAGSDPTLAVDADGRAYFSCVGFDVFSNASMLYVTAAPAGAEGSFYFNISTFGRRFIVAEDNSANVFHDKQFISADFYKTLPNGAANPNANNVYVTWTVFKFDDRCADPDTNPGGYCQSPIFGSMSTNGGRIWSTPELVSGTSDALCEGGSAFDPLADPHSCNFDQGSDNIVLPNGDLQVIFNNGNTRGGVVNSQQLGVHCKPTGRSELGTAKLNCASPTKVGNDVTQGEPQCDFGRGPEECVPGAYIRTNDFPRILNQNSQNGHLYATWQDYRNGEYDIQLAQSLDGGLTWTEAGTVNPDRGLDHYFPAIDRSPKDNGDRIGDSYYRTDRVPNENTTPSGGFSEEPGVGTSDSDYVLAGGTGAETPYDFKVVSPVFPPPDGIQAGFNGDYSGLSINKGSDAHPIWSDTRNVNPFPENSVGHDEDAFTDNVGLPNGRGKPSVGRVGKNN